MAYYREHGVNPLGAFLPVLLQIPVFISLTPMRRRTACSPPGSSSSRHGTARRRAPVSYAGSQVAASLVATRTLQGRQRSFAVALPLLFIGVAARFPAGLLVYWITSSVWGLGPPPPPPPPPTPQRLGRHTAELAAGHVQHLAVHVVRPRRAEEEHRARGLLG